MLTELHVRDLGVIEDLTLTFGPGMTALTGETGAGKTLVVEALQLVLGARAQAHLVRAGAAEALVEARFVVGQGAEEREVVLARSVPAEGRSRAWVDGRMAPLALLAEVAAELVEVHGQHEHRALVTAAAQCAVLDAFAGADTGRVRSLQRRTRDLEATLADLGGDDTQRAREVDMLRYQIEEITAAGLDDPDEEAALRHEEDRLADAAAYREAALAAAQVIETDVGVAEGLTGANELLGRAGEILSARGGFEESSARVRAAMVELSDVARSLRDEAEAWEDDPQRLAAVQDRRRVLAELRRKYGKDLSAVMEFGRAATARSAALADVEAKAAELAGEISRQRAALAHEETMLREARLRAAGEFGAQVGDRLAALAMAGARLEVRIADGGTGEPVELALAANVGEPAQSLARTASGGELARAMLAIRLVGPPGPGTMVFDEVDAGVGGSAALVLGEALHEVARLRQVLVVTHLAQVASRADAQVTVVKDEVDGRTRTTAFPVQDEARVTELSRMLSGHPRSDAARSHARELLEVSEPASSV